MYNKMYNYIYSTRKFTKLIPKLIPLCSSYIIYNESVLYLPPKQLNPATVEQAMDTLLICALALLWPVAHVTAMTLGHAR